MTATVTRTRVRGGIGESPMRSDGIPKVTGNFAYPGDLHADGMLWGATRRSPHARARIVGIDPTAALAMPGVVAVLTQEDVPGDPLFGIEQRDQPVFADGEVRYWGEPLAVVAADDPETARRAAQAIDVELEQLPPLTDPEEADRAGSVIRRMQIRRGDPDEHGEVVVEGYYEVGQQDQAPLGTEAGLAIPDGEGGVDLWATSQWVHKDHEQIYPCLGLQPAQVRCHPAGIGGAFGAREDMSMHIHVCMLALRTRRPVRMVFDRTESFVGHIHRHPGRMWYRHEANRDGKLVRVDCRIILDGGAYASTTSAVIANAGYFSIGPYEVDNVTVEAIGVRTNNPPAGAMRGFGNVQAAFAHEMQMNRLADALEMDPVELRLRNTLESGHRMNTSGQLIEGSLPTRRVIEELASIPLDAPEPGDHPFDLPGGTGLTSGAQHVRRGVGYAVSIKNLAFSEAFDDFCEARVILSPAGVEVHTAAMEVGQGLVTLCQQIARTELGIEQVSVVWDDTSAIGSAGSTSASRQSQMTGGAVLKACEEIRREVLDRYAGDRLDADGVWRGGELVAPMSEVCGDGSIEKHVTFRHPETFPPDEHGQGNPHADFAIAAHRAIVDVDSELGLVRVVRIDTAQDVGKILNPVAARGQIEGGIMQGVGFAIMEELVVEDGVIRNPNFTDYLLPTFADAPDVEYRWVEEPSHWGPYGAKGIGEPPMISAVPAVVSAVGNAIGRPLNRAPVRPEDIVGL